MLARLARQREWAIGRTLARSTPLRQHPHHPRAPQLASRSGHMRCICCSRVGAGGVGEPAFRIVDRSGLLRAVQRMQCRWCNQTDVRTQRSTSREAAKACLSELGGGAPVGGGQRPPLN